MKKLENKENNWAFCPECKGQGKIRGRLRKKVKLRYQSALDESEKIQCSSPVRPESPLLLCLTCNGTGIIQATNFPFIDKENYPNIAIIGGGIGGVALAVACLHRGIPFTLYERDSGFDVRSQGYGLTLQQASKALKAFGILSLADGVYSTNHLVHTTEGKVIVEWGMRKRMQSSDKAPPKRTNVHIARQSLRFELLEQLGGKDSVEWGHQLLGINESDDGVELTFLLNGKIKNAKADLVVGADGIRSAVRRLLIGDENIPLRFLGCMVILGICPLKNLNGFDSPLLDCATVFQTVNGNDRIYVMPFSLDSVMWQLSFPISEQEAKELSALGTKALKEEACRRTNWHDPIPQIIAATQEEQITGYPAYDRALLPPELLEKGSHVTLIGDAAHPMSPFKGQGANQALLDALALARGITKGCKPLSNWREAGIRKSVLSEFEREMLERSASKVKDSAEAAELLHSEIVLREGDGPKARGLKRTS